MRSPWMLVIAAILLIVGFGCGKQKKEDTTGDETTVGTTENAGPEATARAMLEGFKKGDPEPFLDAIDLKGVYEALVPDEDKAEISYDEFVSQVRQGMEHTPPPPNGFEFKIEGSRKAGDVVILTISVKEGVDAEWNTSDIPFKKIDGTWKITAEGFHKMMMGE